MLLFLFAKLDSQAYSEIYFLILLRETLLDCFIINCEHEKEYLVLIRKIPTDRQLEVWRNGVTLRNGYKTLPATVKIQSSSKDNTWLTVVLKEGKKRQIREIGQILGLPVMKIIRVRIGPITLGDLKPGKWRYLKKQEIDLLKHSMII